MRCTENRVTIRGDPGRVFELAWAVEEWPTWLPHYRWVRVLAADGRRRTVEMAARRSGWPVKWISEQWQERPGPDPRQLERAETGGGRICFRHVGGLSRGMEVEWRIEPGAAGVEVSIRHELCLELPLLRSAAGRWVVGELFVRAIASRTLACLKRRVEEEL